MSIFIGFKQKPEKSPTLNTNLKLFIDTIPAIGPLTLSIHPYIPSAHRIQWLRMLIEYPETWRKPSTPQDIPDILYMVKYLCVLNTKHKCNPKTLVPSLISNQNKFKCDLPHQAHANPFSFCTNPFLFSSAIIRVVLQPISSGFEHEFQCVFTVIYLQIANVYPSLHIRIDLFLYSRVDFCLSIGFYFKKKTKTQKI